MAKYKEQSPNLRMPAESYKINYLAYLDMKVQMEECFFFFVAQLKIKMRIIFVSK